MEPPVTVPDFVRRASKVAREILRDPDMTRGHGVVALLGVLALLMALASPARAEDAEAGRRYFKRGQDLLKENDYRGAVRAFEAGYAAAPRVGFLLNIGNCYRKLGELSKAREHYWRFLDAAPKDHPSRPAVMDYLRQMEQIEADGVSVDGAAARAAPPPPSATEPGSLGATRPVPSSLAARPPEPPVAGLTVVDTPPREQSPSIFKRWWFWTLVGGAVAAGAATYVLTRPAAAASCSASLGCAHE
jgi:tetratricopeptide (TPR) repeat protein